MLHIHTYIQHTNYMSHVTVHDNTSQITVHDNSYPEGGGGILS